MLGILLIDKPQGLTSHDVVNRVRRMLGTKRVGHAGSLDPVATGLLVVAVGPATRFLQYLPLEPKVYIADIAFGQSSTTYDTEGELSEARELPADLPAAAEDALDRFRGLIQQVPPMFSAIKVRGQPLYKYARMGQELEREPRTVHMAEFSVLEQPQKHVLRTRIVCSGGTYVRTLAHDLGEALACGAHLVQLRRTSVGKFTVDRSSSLESIRKEQIVPLAEALPPMKLVQTNEVQAQDIREGRAILLEQPIEDILVALLDPAGSVFSVARVEGNLLQPECVIPAEVFDGTF